MGLPGPIRPYRDVPGERRCAVLGAFLGTFQLTLLPKSRLEVLACDEIVDPPGSPWTAATVSYTYGNMTRILQLCSRQVAAGPELTLSTTGGPCEDEFFAAFANLHRAAEAGKATDKLPHAVLLEADPELWRLEPALREWMAP